MRIILLTIMIIFLLGCNEENPSQKKPIRPIIWTEVSLSSLNQIRTLSGIIAPVEAAALSFEVSGKIDAIEVNLGDKVVKGQELARLNQRSLALAQRSAQAKYQQAKVNLADAENSYNRYLKLIKQGVVSQSGFDNAKAHYDSSNSQVDVAKAQVDISIEDLQDSVLRAPYDGIITKRIFEPSQQVFAGQIAFEIEGEHGLEIQVMVPETLIQQLTHHEMLAIRFPALPNTNILGQVTEIGTRAGSANAFPITVVLQSENILLRAGMTAEVEFIFEGVGRTGHKGPAIRIPLTALSAGLAQKTYAFVYDKILQNVYRKEVQTENFLNNEVYISSGLKPGDIIATAGVAFLRDGQKVTLLNKKIQRFN